jgi:signal transduction histidine kinase/streptogramin lyase
MTTMGTADGLPSGPIAAIAADREGNVWVGTSGGLTRIKPRSFASFANAKGLENERTWTVFEDRRGDVWFGTDSIVWRWHDGRIDRYGPDEGLPAFGVTSFAEDADGALWIGSNGGLSRFDGAGMVTLRKSDGLPDDHVRALYEDREGRLWIGTLNGLAVKDHGRLKCYTTADGLPGNWVRSIHEDARGDIWLATTSGLSRLHDGAFTSFRTKDGLADDRVMAIHETADGALWFGTYRGGLSRLKDGRFATISHASGLHDDTVLTIQEDGRGTFWMSSPHGVFRVGRGELDAVADGRSRAVTSVAYDKSDGLPTTDCGGGTQPSGWRARDGRIWFPTSRGVAVLDPERVRVNTIAPAVHVEDVLYDRVHAGGPERVVLPAGTKSVELHYSASALGAPDRVRFRYRLEPFDSDWVDAGSRRVAYFTALRPGTYRFHVTAANESGVWNPTGAVYDLRVEPFFFETSAFAAVVITAIALLVWGAYRLRLRQVESRYAAVLSERGRIARELHDTIAQGFTGVSMQLEAASARLAGAPEAVRDNLDRARSLVRTSLNDARRSVRALRPHLLESGDLATSLRAVAEQLTSGTEVRSSVRVHGSKRRLPLPIEDTLFRMGQEAMTNAVRHGACRTLQITLDVKDGTITLTVEDDGSGFDPSRTENGSGITGMKERIERLGGTLLLKSEPGRGTHLVASVPATWGLSGGDA